MKLMQQGDIPSVSDVARAAEVSRATAYRYFPSQTALIQTAVSEALGPIVDWNSESDDPEERIAQLFETSWPRIEEYEATHRGALWLAIDQWARQRAGRLDDEDQLVRGSRKKVLAEALAPLRDRLDPAAFDKLSQSLSLIFGVEAFVTLKDIWGLEGEELRDVATWAALGLVRQAIADSEGSPPVSASTIEAGTKPRQH